MQYDRNSSQMMIMSIAITTGIGALGFLGIDGGFFLLASRVVEVSHTHNPLSRSAFSLYATTIFFFYLFSGVFFHKSVASFVLWPLRCRSSDPFFPIGLSIDYVDIIE